MDREKTPEHMQPRQHRLWLVKEQNERTETGCVIPVAYAQGIQFSIPTNQVNKNCYCGFKGP